MDYKKEVCAFIDENAKEYTDISHKVWEYAELSLKEHKSAALYVEALKKEGFEVETGLCGIDTAFLGKYGSGRPYIGILAEFDALSGLSQVGCSTEREELVKNGCGHGCGHSMLGAGSFAAACAVKDYLEKSGKPGTVIFYGCPGEEGGASKAFMARENVWRELDAAVTWHPSSVNEVTTGTCNSCIQVLYKFKGLASHAAGNPEAGRSALDAVEVMNIGVQFLREHMKSDCRIHYAIIDGGGVSPNVVQPTASVLYMVRSVAVKDSVALQARVDKIAEGAALITETEYERIFVDGTANTVPNSVLEKLMWDNMSDTELPKYTAEEMDYAAKLKASYKPSGDLPGFATLFDKEIAKFVKEKSENGTKVINDFIMPYYTSDAFSPGSTDVGDVSWQTPTVQCNAACETADSPGHSWQNVSVGASTIGDKGLLFAGKVMAKTAIDLFEKPEVLAAAKAEFAERTESGYVCPIPDGEKPYIIEV